MNILQINSSARSEGSQSSSLADLLARQLLASQPGARRVVRDLTRNPHPALDEFALQSLFTPTSELSAEQAQRVARDDALIAEIKNADVVVIGAPMYNFGISSQLKNWIDAISRARVTFRYTEAGAEGLLTGKKVYVLLTRGGRYRDTAADSQVPYLNTVLGFLGMTDVHFIYVEGLAMGDEAVARSVAGAQVEIGNIIAGRVARTGLETDAANALMEAAV